MLSFDIYVKSTPWGFHLNYLVPEITSKSAPCNSSGITAQELALVSSRVRLPLLLAL